MYSGLRPGWRRWRAEVAEADRVAQGSTARATTVEGEGKRRAGCTTEMRLSGEALVTALHTEASAQLGKAMREGVRQAK